MARIRVRHVHDGLLDEVFSSKLEAKAHVYELVKVSVESILKYGISLDEAEALNKYTYEVEDGRGGY